MQTKLTHELVQHLFNYNPKTGDLNWKLAPFTKAKKGAPARTKKGGYYQVRIYGKHYLVHRIIWLYVYGYLPENSIDHIDRNGQNNKLNNLREVSQQCNSRNTGLQINNKSGITGVSFSLTQLVWFVGITVNKTHYYLGSFDDFIEAVCTRLAAEQCLNWADCNANSPANQYVNTWLNETKCLEKSYA